jgi:hypothetical protein
MGAFCLDEVALAGDGQALESLAPGSQPGLPAGIKLPQAISRTDESYSHNLLDGIEHRQEDAWVGHRCNLL